MEENKIKGIIAYLLGFFGGLVIYFTEKENKNLKFHAAQSISWSLVYLLIYIAYAIIPFRIPFFSTILTLLNIFVVIKGCVSAYNDEEYRFPVLGDITDKVIEVLK